MPDAPKIVLDRLRAAAPREAHPDADVLTAFAEQALSGAERENVMRHLSRCGDCREVVALSLPPSMEVQVKPQPVAEQTPIGKPVSHSRNWFAWPTLRWAALAASVVVVASVLWLNPGKQPNSTTGTEDAAIPTKIQTPSSETVTNAVTSTRSEPQALPVTAGSVAEKTAPRERRTAPRDQQLLARAQTPAAASPSSLAENKRLDALQDKDTLSYNTGRFAAKQPTRSGIVANDKLSATDQSGTSANGMALASTAANEAPAAPAVGGLLAKNDAPVAPIEKAKPAAKEEADLKSQYQPAPTQNTLSALATESEVVARREKASAKQFKKISVPQWSLAQGKLQRSFDAGKTWQIALQLDRPVLTFGVLASDVWAGTQGGTIFHSTDGGARWATIQPATNAATLTSDIVAIEIRSTTEVLLTASTGEFWITSDAGKTWDKTTDKK